MGRVTWGIGTFVLGLLLVVGQAEAGRVPTTRSTGQKTTLDRNDITVPYLTSGKTTFMNNNVAPRIYSSPIVDDPRNPGAKPVFNLPFWGAVQSFGDRSNGATPRGR
jgi:hypothetical protein